MNSDRFEELMRLGERYHALKVPYGLHIVIRVDGRSFSRLTARLTEKPFDRVFHNHMVATAKALLDSLCGVYAFTESDEISVLLPKSSDHFDRKVEKLVSTSAARAASTMALHYGEGVEFDSRIWVGETDQDVIDYFRWRQADAERCGLNGHAYWALRGQMSAGQATSLLYGVSKEKKLALLAENSIDFEQVPAWQRYGTGLYVQSVQGAGFNPTTCEHVVTQRRQVVIDEQLPTKDAYSEFLRTHALRLVSEGP